MQDVKEITLDDGTKVSAQIIRTVNQPKGGKVNVYVTQDGQQYYQYVDKNGKQQKVTKVWDYFDATEDNLKVAWDKFKAGHPLDALMTFIEGAEDPRVLTPGVAPCDGIAKGAGFFKSMKDFGKSLKQLKNIKTFDQFKSFAIGLAQKIKPAKQMKPRKNLPYAVDYEMYNLFDKSVIAESFVFGNRLGQQAREWVLNPEVTEKILSNLSKTLGKKINPKDLKVVAGGEHTSTLVKYKVTYFDNTTGKVYIYGSEGIPDVILEIEYSITRKIKSYEITDIWSGGSSGEWLNR